MGREMYGNDDDDDDYNATETIITPFIILFVFIWSSES